MTSTDLSPLPGVSAAVHAAFPALVAIPQLVEEISAMLDYSALWSLEDASSIGDLRLVQRVAAHDQRRATVVDPPPSDLARRATFTAATAEAAEEGHLVVFQWLVTHYASSGWDVTDAMVRASRHGHLDVLQWAQSHEELARFRWTTKMMVVAAIEGHFEIVRWLHEHSSAPGSPHWLDENVAVGNRRRAFASAVRWGHLEVVKVLAKYCSVNASVDTTRELAAARRWAEADMRVTNTSRLLRVRRERVLYSQRILDGPAEENAVWYGRLEVLQFLFSNGMVSKNGRSRTELAETATARGHANEAQWLVDFTTADP
ncbi:hypothetical protein PF008_g5442 [Phytophthora fragariae]|uniref:Uncharacterized protein n=1 Tax=Phytophthora fragariae TaxID=53985 RepID=A0A6G0S9F0_9STRA|nr:hypothetical protein PF008_g5442 [Phytophthora fragariae]